MDVNREAIDHMTDAAVMMGDARCCPFCGMWWDQAVAERLVMDGDHKGYREWIEETIALPLNATGPDLGQRGST